MKWRHTRGFSLLEVLVAFSVLALSLGILMRIFSVSLRNAEVVHGQGQAVALAQSLLTEAGIVTPLIAGEKSGTVGDQYHWKVRMRPFADALTHPVAELKAQAGLDLWEVTVEVQWGQSGSDAPRTFDLSSLRVQTPALP